MTKRFARLSVAVGFAILLCYRLPSLTVTQDEQLDGSRWTLEATFTSLPSVEPLAAFNGSENKIFPFGAVNYPNDARPALLQTNKFFSSFLDPLSSDAMTGLFLSSRTKEDMQLLRGSNWTFLEDLPTFHWMPPVFEINSVKEMEWIDYFPENERPQQLDYVAGARIYFGAENLMAYAQLCLIAGERGRDDLEASCVDQVEAGLVFYSFSTNGNPIVYDTRLESNVKSTSGVWRTALSMSYTVVQKHLEEMP